MRTFPISDDALHRLAELKSDFGISTSKSIRQGVSLFLISHRQKKLGNRLAYLDDNDNPVLFVTL